MKNMIEQIVEMDQQAQQITADAQRRKVQSGQEIQQLREKIQEEYLQRARKRLKTNEEIEREAAKTAASESCFNSDITNTPWVLVSAVQYCRFIRSQTGKS